MLILSAKIRKALGKKVKTLRSKGVLPAVLYGPKLKNENIEVGLKEFEKIFHEAGQSSLISLELEGKKKYLVLVHDLSRDSLENTPTHVDFYQPSLTEKIEVKVPIILEGEAEAVKNLGGTLIKNIAEVVVKALPQSLPKEIRVSVERLKAFEDTVLIKDLKVGEGVEILGNPQEIVAQVRPLEKVEEELKKPIEEKVEEVEKIVKEKKEEVPAEDEKVAPAKAQSAKEEKKQEKVGRSMK